MTILAIVGPMVAVPWPAWLRSIPRRWNRSAERNLFLEASRPVVCSSQAKAGPRTSPARRRPDQVPSARRVSPSRKPSAVECCGDGTKSDVNPGSRRTALTALGLALAQFLFCAVCITSPEPVWFQDAVLYEAVGANLAAGHGYSADDAQPFRPEITRTPFLPAMVAAVYTLTGRNPRVVIWLNAALVSAAVSTGYLVLLRLTRDRAVALSGGLATLFAPFVSGSAATIGTEPAAMLQVAVGALLLLRWPGDRDRKFVPLRAAGLGLLLASLVLNRVNLLPATLVAGAFVVVSTLRGRWRRGAAWVTTTVFCLSFVAPVLLWSARNAAVGLSFSPSPIGLYASRVHDVMRYREAIFQGHPPPPPQPNVRFFQNWRVKYAPEGLMQLEEENKAWFREFRSQRGDRYLAAIPARLLGLFSSSTVSTFPMRDPEGLSFPGPLLRWISRGLWLLSLAGVVVLWKNPWAKWLWLVPVLTLVPIHLMTVCTSRYMTALMPLLLPYAGAAIVWAWRRFENPVQTGVAVRQADVNA